MVGILICIWNIINQDLDDVYLKSKVEGMVGLQGTSGRQSESVAQNRLSQRRTPEQTTSLLSSFTWPTHIKNLSHEDINLCY